MRTRPKGQKRPLYRKEGDLRGSDTIDGNVTRPRPLQSSLLTDVAVAAPSFIIPSNQLEHITAAGRPCRSRNLTTTRSKSFLAMADALINEG